MQEETTGMREKGIDKVEWINKEKWIIKAKLQARKDVKTVIFSTEINKFTVIYTIQIRELEEVNLFFCCIL